MFYNLDVEIYVFSDLSDNNMTHVIYDLKFNNENFIQKRSNFLIQKPDFVNHLKIDCAILFDLFPFIIIFKKNLEIILIGDSLKQVLKHYQGECINDLFNLDKPLVSFSWENVRKH